MIATFNLEKKGYNFRISSLNSLAAVIEFLTPEDLSGLVIPILLKAMKDNIPNVRFTVPKILIESSGKINT